MNNYTEMIFRVQMEQLVTERLGMVAENENRARRQESPAYVEKDFQNVNQLFADLEVRIREAG